MYRHVVCVVFFLQEVLLLCVHKVCQLWAVVLVHMCSVIQVCVTSVFTASLCTQEEALLDFVSLSCVVVNIVVEPGATYAAATND